MSAFPHAHYLKGAHEPTQFVPDIGAEVCFGGRSNSGKSSAINAITQRAGLARTSKTPGHTQLVNFFELEPGRRLVDLPGYGFAKVPRPLQEHWKTLLEAYFRDRSSLKALFLIVDVRRGLGDQDMQMVGFARACGRTVHILLTKADKLTRNQGASALAAARRQLGDAGTAQLLSSPAKTGVDEARKALRAFLKEKTPAGDKPPPG
jgi:GTP-binding protein